MSPAFKSLFVFAASVLTLTGCKDDDETFGVPEVHTLSVTEITSEGAIGGGNVTADGGAPVISRGLVWSIEPDPTLENHGGLKLEGTGLGVFTSTISGLIADQTYLIRAFATNAAGTSYGQLIEFNSLVAEPPAYPPGTIHCIENGTEVIPVYSPATGRIWMDRNLGATRVATFSNDEASYGDLYQWGRFSDGHQCRNSTTTSVLSSIDTPNHGSFIVSTGSQTDWRSPQNDDLWQSLNETNNPCPNEYRLPTYAEWNLESEIYSLATAFAGFYSPLKIPAAGYRGRDGNFYHIGFIGFYWSSTVIGVNVRSITLLGNAAGVTVIGRAAGGSVRCIKD